MKNESKNLNIENLLEKIITVQKFAIQFMVGVLKWHITFCHFA